VKSIPEIARAVQADTRDVKNSINKLAERELLVPDELGPSKWVANLPIYAAAELAASEEVGRSMPRPKQTSCAPRFEGATGEREETAC